MNESTTSDLHPAHQWVVEHDDRWLFVALYIGLAVVLSIWISLFWLVVVVGVHFVFELIRQSHQQRGRILAQALWEIKLDIGLVLLALAMALYMEIVLGVLGLQSAARLGAASRIGTRGVRFAAWERTLRGILLSADDAAQVARVFARGRNRRPEAGTTALPEAPSSWRGRWRVGDGVAVGLALVSLALLLLSPWLTGHTAASAWATLLAELQPFP